MEGSGTTEFDGGPERVGRGMPYEYDPGPPRNRSWPALFAATPNYRGLGLAVTDTEAFRWHFGPVFYRGRLTDGAVSVLVIGQEGASDECLAGRAFVGETGTRTQHLLHHLGITRSYLCLNTFLYPIFDQYDARLRGLAQDPASPITRHRHRLLDYVLARNDVHLVLAVGTAAKETVVTWVRSRGGACPGRRDEVSRCDASVLGPRVRVVGLRHPGAAAFGEESARQLAEDWAGAVARIDSWRAEAPGWLPPDPDGRPGRAAGYVFGSAPIPFRDLPYGVAWRLGDGGTASRRTDRQRGIELSSRAAADAGFAVTAAYDQDGAGSEEGYASDDGDVPYEPPRRAWRDFDRGPPPVFARLLQGAEPGLPWPDFGALGVPGDGSFGLAGTYRGRFDDVRAYVLVDQHDDDDLFCWRALTGDAGQHLQGVLDAMGLAHGYLIVRVLPVDTLALPAATVRSLVDHPRTRSLHATLFERVRARNPDLAVVLAVGPSARRLVAGLPTGELPVVALKGWWQRGARRDWQRTLDALAHLTYRPDAVPTFTWDGRRRQIPRADLPFGSVRWRGTSGTRAVRGSIDGQPSPDHVKLFLPDWVARLAPAALSDAERASVDVLTGPPRPTS